MLNQKAIEAPGSKRALVEVLVIIKKKIPNYMELYNKPHAGRKDLLQTYLRFFVLSNKLING
jgi:hypothetical protein